MESSPIVPRAKGGDRELPRLDVPEMRHRGEDLFIVQSVQQAVSPMPSSKQMGLSDSPSGDSDDSLDNLQVHSKEKPDSAHAAATTARNEDRRAGAGGRQCGEVEGSREGDAGDAAGWREEGEGARVEKWKYGERLALLQRMRAEEEYDLELQKHTEHGAVGWLRGLG